MTRLLPNTNYQDGMDIASGKFTALKKGVCTCSVSVVSGNTNGFLKIQVEKNNSLIFSIENSRNQAVIKEI